MNDFSTIQKDKTQRFTQLKERYKKEAKQLMTKRKQELLKGFDTECESIIRKAERQIQHAYDELRWKP